MNSFLKIAIGVLFFSMFLGCTNYVKKSKAFQKIKEDIEIIERANKDHLRAVGKNEERLKELKARNNELKEELKKLESGNNE